LFLLTISTFLSSSLAESTTLPSASSRLFSAMLSFSLMFVSSSAK